MDLEQGVAWQNELIKPNPNQHKKRILILNTAFTEPRAVFIRKAGPLMFAFDFLSLFPRHGGLR
jgi:hypothetical protein